MQFEHVVRHPLLSHSLTIIRDRNTGTDEFRKHSAIVSQIMIMEATRSLPVYREEIETPLETTTGELVRSSVVFVPVLRAGISMLVPALEFLPWAAVGFIGLERDEQTAIAHKYYQKFPDHLDEKHVLVLDPMLATGGSVSDTIAALKEHQARSITAVCIVAAPEGISNLREYHPDVRILTAAVDSYLDANKFIVPGLGDFGDRYFGT